MTASVTADDLGQQLDDLMRRVAALEQRQTNAAATAIPRNINVDSVTYGSPVQETGSLTSNPVTGWTSGYPQSSIFLDQLYLDLSWTGVASANEYQIEVARRVSTGPDTYDLPRQYRTSGTQIRISSSTGGERLLPGQTYGVRVYAVNSLGIPSTPFPSSGYTNVTMATDTVAPVAPTGLNVTVGLKSIMATWNDATDNDFDVFQLEIATNNTFSVGVRDTYARGSIASFTDLLQGTSYYVRVRTLDTSGNAGPWTNWGAPTAVVVGQVQATDVGFTVAGANRLYNSSFENSSITLDQWTTTGGAASSTAQAHTGTHSVALVRASSSVPIMTGAGGNNAVALAVGDKVVLTAWMYVATAGMSSVKINLYGGGGPTDLPASLADTTIVGSWQRVRAAYTIATAATYYPRAYIDGGIDGTAYVDDLQLEFGDVPTAYGPRPDEILPNTISGPMVQPAAITFDKTSLSVGGGNLVRNSSFETNTTIPYDQWGFSGAGTWTKDSAEFRYGTYSAKLVASTTDNYISQSIFLKAGRYVVSWWVKRVSVTAPSAGGGSGCIVITPTGTATLVASSPAATQWNTQEVFYLATGSNGWQREQFTFDLSADATVGFYAYHWQGPTGTGITGTTYWDGLQIERGDLATAYAPKPDEILPGTVGTTEIAALAITAAKIAANTITAAQIAASTITATQIQAGSITADRLTVGTFGPSMVPNGSFEDLVPGSSTQPAKWSYDAFTGGTMATSTTTSRVKGGTQSVSANCTSTTNNLFINSDLFPAEAAKVYALEMWYMAETTTTSGIYFEVYWYDQTQTLITTTFPLSNVGANAGVWTLFQQTVTAPANTCYMRCRIGVANTSAVTVINFDEVKVNEQIGATRISDQGITAPKLQAGSVTTDKLTVATFGNDLILNGGFEDFATGSATLPANWNVPGSVDSASWSAGSTYAVAASNQDAGSQCFSIAIPSSPSTSAGNIASAAFPIVAGKDYYLKVRVKGSVATTGLYVFLAYGTTQNFAITQAAANYTVLTAANNASFTTSYQTYEGKITVPAGMTWGRVWIFLSIPGAATTMYIDGVECSPVVVSAIIGNGTIQASNIQAGTITANEIHSATITAGQMVVGTITAASGIIANAAIGTAQIQTAAITNALIGNLAVDTAQINTAAIVTAKIGSLQVTDATINTLTVAKITSGAISTADLQITSSGQIRIGTAPGTSQGVLINSSGISAYNTGGTRTVFIDASTGSGTFFGTISSGTAITSPSISGGTITGALHQSSASNPRVYFDSNDFNVVDSGGVTQFKAGNTNAYVTIPGKASASLGAGFVLGGTAQYLSFSKNGASDPGFTMSLLSSNPTLYFGALVFLDNLQWDSTSRRFSFSNNGQGLKLVGTTGGGSQLWGDWGGNGGAVADRASAHTITFNWTGSALQFLVDNGVQKTFVIPHPVDPEKLLVHACLEGPDQAEVFYRGRAETDWRGQVWVSLPDYFEDLCEIEGRDVWLQSRFDRHHSGKAERLEAGDILGGGFEVKGSPHTEFSWVVFARRRGTQFTSEPRRDSVVVRGDGPYRYIAA